MTDQDSHRSIEAVWRLESARLLGALVRIVRDVGRAEDLAQDALVAALAQWPESGVPANPGGWLMAVAKRRALDGFRRDERQDRAYAQVGQSLEQFAGDVETAVDHVEDDVLRLMFLCCHPCLTSDAQVTLALRLLAGLTAKEIARSFLTSESTIGQRITRAKRLLADARSTTEEPGQDQRAERLSAVLGVLYLLFNEGYSRPLGTIGRALRCARRHCGSAASLPGSSPASRRCTGSWRSWRSSPRVRRRAQAATVSPS